MIVFPGGESTVPGYLALPQGGQGPGVLVLHEWWGLTEPFKQVCDRLAEAGFVALAPDFYRGKTTASIEEAEALGAELDRNVKRWRGDIVGALQFLRQHGATRPTDGRGAFGFVAFSLGGSYALDMSINLAEEIAAVVTFYATYPGLDYHGAKAAYLCHFAEEDPYVSAESAVEMEQALGAAGRQTTCYTYPGTRHWFFDANRVEAYDASAAALAWERTVAFLNAELRR
ncbi:dienelactone hydrolase family protein [Ktedonobacter racemifer]|uniref:Dienelactone hydrolase n=1 Tax=Ktedonobacter racemifer DSM 44963 TaxID=485913 RepID=D6TTC4_KTERA|nr:dienelactone hydrolase family protein [Ktedonobacter racemifer]EFH83675.1 dienelactone hydrolase [Ktedonobacter racemifer DSM 44963]